MKTILSIFDFSGNWCELYKQNGNIVFQWDIKIDELMDINSIDLVETALDLFENVDGILAAVPCNDFAVSGSQYWRLKDQNGQTQKSIELVNQVERLVDLFTPTDPDYDEKFFWVIENPVGRLEKFFPHFGKPYYFNPCDFAGNLNLSQHEHNELDRIRRKDGLNIEKFEVDFVIQCEAYTKKTGLWGSFNDPVKNPVEPVRVCKQGSPIQFFGGKSEKTKENRSKTPLGFSIAFYNSNN